VAEVGAAFHEAGVAGGGAGGVGAGAVFGAVEGGAEPIVAPLPGVAGDAVEAVAVGRVGVDGRGAGVAVFGGVVLGKAALPDVAEVLAVGSEVVAPGIDGLIEAAAGCVLPLGFGGQTLAGRGGPSGS